MIRLRCVGDRSCRLVDLVLGEHVRRQHKGCLVPVLPARTEEPHPLTMVADFPTPPTRACHRPSRSWADRLGPGRGMQNVFSGSRKSIRCRVPYSVVNSQTRLRVRLTCSALLIVPVCRSSVAVSGLRRESYSRSVAGIVIVDVVVVRCDRVSGLTDGREQLRSGGVEPGGQLDDDIKGRIAASSLQSADVGAVEADVVSEGLL